MACGDYTNTTDLYDTAFETMAAQDIFTCPLVFGMGEVAYPLALTGGLLAGVFIASRSPIPVVMVAILTGGLLIGTLPSAAATIVAGGALFVVAAIFMLVVIKLMQAR